MAAPDPADMVAGLNPDSLATAQALVEPAVIASSVERFQFERVGYFHKDPMDSDGATPTFNGIVPLRESRKP